MLSDSREDIPKDTPAPRLIIFLWAHVDLRLDLQAKIWSQGNADGSYYVDWDRAARGTFREVSMEEADRIAIAAHPSARVERIIH